MACVLAVGFGLFAILVFTIGLFHENATSVGWSFGGDYGWSYKGSPRHPLGIVAILEPVLWALAGFALLKGKNWALDLLFALLALRCLDWLVASVLQAVKTYPNPSYRLEFVFPLLVMAVTSGQLREWRSPSSFKVDEKGREQSRAAPFG